MRSSLILSLALGLLAGCSSHHSTRSAPQFTFNTNAPPRSARSQAQTRDRRSPAPPPRKESDRSLIDLSRQWGRIASVNNQLHFVVLDSKLQQPSKFIDLPSNFTFDAISDSGQSLYLEEHVGANGSNGYRVRVYDLQAGQLTQGIFVDKAVGTDAMNGVRVGTIASPDGAWQYTLYWRQGGNPFIHAIKLEERWSLCLVLPVQTSGEEDFAWSFVASPDGRTAYAINSLKGYVASVNLISATVIKTATLDVPRSSAPNLVDQVAQFFFPVAEAKSEMFSLAVVSPDGKTLYASGDYGRKLFAIATDTLAIKNTFTFASLSGAPLQMTALGLSPDGLRLYAIDAEGGALMHLDASTGRTLAQVKLTGTNGGRIVRVVHR